VKCIIFILCMLVAIAGCSRDYQPYVTIDCNKKTIVKLTAPQDKTNIHAIEIRIKGKLNGRGIIEWIEGGKKKVVSGDVDLNWNRKWDQTDCRISYSPIGSASGELRIYYKFNT